LLFCLDENFELEPNIPKNKPPEIQNIFVNETIRKLIAESQINSKTNSRDIEKDADFSDEKNQICETQKSPPKSYRIHLVPTKNDQNYFDAKNNGKISFSDRLKICSQSPASKNNKRKIICIKKTEAKLICQENINKKTNNSFNKLDDQNNNEILKKSKSFVSLGSKPYKFPFRSVLKVSKYSVKTARKLDQITNYDLYKGNQVLKLFENKLENIRSKSVSKSAIKYNKSDPIISQYQYISKRFSQNINYNTKMPVNKAKNINDSYFTKKIQRSKTLNDYLKYIDNVQKTRIAKPKILLKNKLIL